MGSFRARPGHAGCPGANWKLPALGTGAVNRRNDGQEAEDAARAWLEAQGLACLQANFTCRQGEIDLIMRQGDYLVFVEVRRRRSADFGGAAASIGATKQGRIIRAASAYLQRTQWSGPCRVDVVAIEDDGRINWIRDAIQASV